MRAGKGRTADPKIGGPRYSPRDEIRRRQTASVARTSVVEVRGFSLPSRFQNPKYVSILQKFSYCNRSVKAREEPRTPNSGVRATVH